LFCVSAYLGAVSAPAGAADLSWAGIAVISLFLPGLLLAVSGLWLWRKALQLPAIGPMLAGVNAGVVGVLAAAFCSPVVSTSIHTPIDALIGFGGLLLLARARAAPLIVVAACVGASAAWALWGPGGTPAIH
jgi:chromate transporter